MVVARDCDRAVRRRVVGAVMSQPLRVRELHTTYKVREVADDTVDRIPRGAHGPVPSGPRRDAHRARLAGIASPPPEDNQWQVLAEQRADEKRWQAEGGAPPRPSR